MSADRSELDYIEDMELPGGYGAQSGRREIYQHKKTKDIYYSSGQGSNKTYKRVKNLSGLSDSEYNTWVKKLSKFGKLAGESVKLSNEIQGTCKDMIGKHSLWKEAFGTPILAGTLLMLQERVHRDNVFVNTCLQIVTIPKGREVNKSMIFNNLSRFVFGNKEGAYPASGNIFRKHIEHFHLIVYVSLVTEYRLLSGIRTEDGTFKHILEKAGGDLLDFKGWGYRARFRTRNCDKEEVGTSFIGSPVTGTNCSFKQWNEVYSLIPQKSLEKAIKSIIFS